MTAANASSADDLVTRLSRRRFEADLDAAPFQVGLARGHWDIVDQAFPNVLIKVHASEITYAQGWLGLRFDLTGYPNDAPTACPWDLEVDQKLAADKRPRGGRATAVFNPNWMQGEALYLPCDRRALPGHTQWLTEHVHLLWEPAVGIIKYLTIVHTILNEATHA